MWGLSEVLRQEGREGGFGVSVLCPGGVNTRIYAADRNRPERFGPQVSGVAFEDLEADIKKGLDPAVVGDLVLEAILANRLYIFTDPRFVKLVQNRHEKLLADFEWAAQSDALNGVKAPGSIAARPPVTDGRL